MEHITYISTCFAGSMRQNLARGLATGAAFRLAEATDWGRRVLGRTKIHDIVCCQALQGRVPRLRLNWLVSIQEETLAVFWMAWGYRETLFWRIVLPNVSCQIWTTFQREFPETSLNVTRHVAATVSESRHWPCWNSGCWVGERGLVPLGNLLGLSMVIPQLGTGHLA